MDRPELRSHQARDREKKKIVLDKFLDFAYNSCQRDKSHKPMIKSSKQADRSRREPQMVGLRRSAAG